MALSDRLARAVNPDPSALETERLEREGELLQVLGQPTRLKILGLLVSGPRCVCDIQVAIGEEQSNVSKHLGILRRAGILRAERQGIRVAYRLSNPDVIRLLECAERAIANVA